MCQHAAIILACQTIKRKRLSAFDPRPRGSFIAFFKRISTDHLEQSAFDTQSVIVLHHQ
jgi:hypothetical protein